jgi:ApaG protein
MSKTTAELVKISVETKFNPLQSDIENGVYFFTYHILIENNSDHTIQLVYRKWTITDSNGENRFVEGEGVVGEKPILCSGELYDYYSGCILQTGIGKMSGSYVFRLHDAGGHFEVVIPEFNLLLPWVLN